MFSNNSQHNAFSIKKVFQALQKGLGIRRLLTCTVSAVALLSASISSADEVTQENLPADSVVILNKVIEEARLSAQESFTVDDHGLDASLKNMDYQTYRAIRYKADHSLWHGENDYEVQFFHPGFLFKQPVSVITVDNQNQEHPVPFNKDAFSYDQQASNLSGLTNENAGFAGFRVHYPIKNSEYKDEFAVFQGASYFRLIGRDNVYGISARGLAIDTAETEGEEFPYFTKFWLIEPKENGPIVIYARLESPSVAGAYRFELTPGKDTEMKVKSWLFAREDVKKLGVAPFTSMFLYGEHSQSKPDDYRPEVHDSDGVLMVTNAGEQIWRPLTNPAHLQITSLVDTKPQGFGMLQRDTDFDHYLDQEAAYHKRPGLWVTPEEGFDEGRVEVVEIPTRSEVNDNIVAYWVPKTPFNQGDSRYFSYTIRTVDGNVEQQTTTPLMTVLRTRQGSGIQPGEEESEKAKTVKSRRFVVDFTLPESLSGEIQNLSVQLSAANGQVSQARLYPVNDGTELRATFLLQAAQQATADMRLYIAKDNQRVSEVWNYVYQAK